MQGLAVQNGQPAIARLQHAVARQPRERGIAALARDAAQAGDFLLRYLQPPIGARMRLRRQLRGDRPRHHGVHVQQHIAAVAGHQPVHPLRQVHHERLGERDAVVPQPFADIARQDHHAARPQGDHFVIERRGAQHGGLAEPAAGAETRQRQGLAVDAGRGPFHQPVDHAVPAGRARAHAEQVFALAQRHQPQAGANLGALRRRQAVVPGHHVQHPVNRALRLPPARARRSFPVLAGAVRMVSSLPAAWPRPGKP